MASGPGCAKVMLRMLLLGPVLWWAGSRGREAAGTVPALLPPNLQQEGSGLGLDVVLLENKAPEPQPLSCRCFSCCSEVGLTEVFSLRDIIASALSVCWGTQPGLMAPSPARGRLELGYLVLTSLGLDVLPPPSHSTEIAAVHPRSKTKQIDVSVKEQGLLCGSAWALRVGRSGTQQPGYRVAVHTFTYTIFFPPTALLPYLNASMSFFN